MPAAGEGAFSPFAFFSRGFMLTSMVATPSSFDLQGFRPGTEDPRSRAVRTGLSARREEAAADSPPALEIAAEARATLAASVAARIGLGGWAGTGLTHAAIAAASLWAASYLIPPTPLPELEIPIVFVREAPPAEPAPVPVPPPVTTAALPEPPPEAAPPPAVALPIPPAIPDESPPPSPTPSPKPRPHPRPQAPVVHHEALAPVAPTPVAPTTATPAVPSPPPVNPPTIVPPPAQVAALPILPPRPISGASGNPRPDYPAAARRHGLQGKVVLRVEVSAEGRAQSVEVKVSSGHSILDEAALDAVRRWRFNPASQNGNPVAGAAEVPIEFRLVD